MPVSLARFETGAFGVDLMRTPFVEIRSNLISQAFESEKYEYCFDLEGSDARK